MRPKKAEYIIDKVLSHWYCDTGQEFLYPREFVKALIVWSKRDYRRKVLYNKNPRNTKFKYNLSKNITVDYTNWRSQMVYISDRWREDHIVYWLLHGVINNKFI